MMNEGTGGWSISHQGTREEGSFALGAGGCKRLHGPGWDKALNILLGDTHYCSRINIVLWHHELFKYLVCFFVNEHTGSNRRRPANSTI